MSLSWLLTFSVLFELLLRRLGTQLLALYAASSATTPAVQATIGTTARFSLHFVGVLALFILLRAVWLLVRDEGLFDRPGRMGVAIGATVFLPLATVALSGQLSASFAAYLTVSLAALILLLLIGFFRRPASTRGKVGLFYFSLPLLLQCHWLYSQQLRRPLLAGRSAALALQARAGADHLAAGGAVAALICFAPLESTGLLFRGGPLAVSASVAMAVLYTVSNSYSASGFVARYAFNIGLPAPNSLTLNAYAVGAFPFALTITSLLWQGGVASVTGQGLLLLALAGLNQHSPHLALVSLVALVQLVRAHLTAKSSSAGSAPRRYAWADLWSSLSRELSNTGAGSDPIVLRHQQSDITRISGTVADLPYVARVAVKQGVVEEIAFEVGQPPKDEPPIALSRRRGRKGRAAPDAPVALAECFVVQDETGRVEQTLGDAASEIAQSVEGWLGIWPAEGVRCVHRPKRDGLPSWLGSAAQDEAVDIAPLVRLVWLLARVAQEMDVTPSR